MPFPVVLLTRHCHFCNRPTRFDLRADLLDLRPLLVQARHDCSHLRLLLRNGFFFLCDFGFQDSNGRFLFLYLALLLLDFFVLFEKLI